MVSKTGIVAEGTSFLKSHTGTRCENNEFEMPLRGSEPWKRRSDSKNPVDADLTTRHRVSLSCATEEVKNGIDSKKQVSKK